MPDGPLRCEVTAGVAEVVIDHPPTNLVDGSFIGTLIGLLGELESDDATPLVVFTSADPDFFLMHGDVNSILAIPPGADEPATEPNVAAGSLSVCTAVAWCRSGWSTVQARGGGAEFLAVLDLRYGSERAVLGQPEVAMGNLPRAGGTAWATASPRSRSRAEGDPVRSRRSGVEEAVRIGWLEAVQPSVELGGVVRALATVRIAVHARCVGGGGEAGRRPHARVVRRRAGGRDRRLRRADRGWVAHRPDGAFPRRRRPDPGGRDR